MITNQLIQVDRLNAINKSAPTGNVSELLLCLGRAPRLTEELDLKPEIIL